MTGACPEGAPPEPPLLPDPLPVLLVPALLLVPLPLLPLLVPLLLVPLALPLVLPLPLLVAPLLPELLDFPPLLLLPLLLPLPEPASGSAEPNQVVSCDPAHAATNAQTPTQHDTVPKLCIHHLRLVLASEHRASDPEARSPLESRDDRRCTTVAP
jgi:hypothetical protein